jgi:serine/threonine protein kinase
MIKQHQIKIGDFGLAKVLSQDLGKSLAGSPLNMAPEILEHK